MGQKKSYKNVAEVYRYLQAEGYKVKHATVYNASNTGILRKQLNGRFAAADVEMYKTLLTRVGERRKLPDKELYTVRNELHRQICHLVALRNVLDDALDARQAAGCQQGGGGHVCSCGAVPGHVCQCSNGAAAAAADGQADESQVEPHGCGCDKWQ